MKTINLIALLGFVTFSAMADGTPLMTQTQNQGQSTKVEQQVERQTNVNEGKSGVQDSVGSQNGIGAHKRIHTHTRTHAQDGSGGGQNMGNGMQNGGMQGGGMQGGGKRGGK